MQQAVRDWASVRVILGMAMPSILQIVNSWMPTRLSLAILLASRASCIHKPLVLHEDAIYAEIF